MPCTSLVGMGKAIGELMLQPDFGPIIASGRVTVFLSGRERPLALDVGTGATDFPRKAIGTPSVLIGDTRYRREGASALVALGALNGAKR